MRDSLIYFGFPPFYVCSQFIHIYYKMPLVLDYQKSRSSPEDLALYRVSLGHYKINMIAPQISVSILQLIEA